MSSSILATHTQPLSPMWEKVHAAAHVASFLTNTALLVAAVAYTFFSLELPFIALCFTLYAVVHTLIFIFVHKYNVHIAEHRELSDQHQKLKTLYHEREQSLQGSQEKLKSLSTLQSECEAQQLQLKGLQTKVRQLRAQEKVLSTKQRQIHSLLEDLERDPQTDKWDELHALLFS